MSSVEFSRQEYWSGLPFPSPGHLPNPGIKPESLASPALAGGFFTGAPPGKPCVEPQNVKLIKTESRMMVSRGGG